MWRALHLFRQVNVNIFKSGTNNLAKVLSAVAALVLWFHVTSGASFTTTVSLPIRYIAPARGLMVAGGVPDHVLVQARGPGRALLSYSLRKHPAEARRYVVVNLGGLPGGKHPVAIHADQVNLGVDGLAVERIIENAEFTVSLDLKVQRTVAVNADSLPGLQVAKDAVMVRPPAVVPRFVRIEGPEGVVRTIRSVPIKTLVPGEVSLRDTVLHATLDTLANPFVTVSPGEVELRFALEPLAEKVIPGIPVRPKDFPWNRYAFEPNSLTVTVRGPESVISKLRPRDIMVIIPYRSFLAQAVNGGNAVKPEITFPKGVTAVTLAPDTVRITLRGAKG
jgi:hypothetical protein